MLRTFYIAADQVSQFETVLKGLHIPVPAYRSASDAKKGSLRVYEVDADDGLMATAVLAERWVTPARKA